MNAPEATDTGMIPASALMEMLWWIHQRARNKSVYNQTWPLKADRALDLAALRVAWQAVVDRYEALRASLHHRDGTVMVSVADHVDVEPQWIAIDDPGSTPVEPLLRSIAGEIQERPLALDVAPAARLVAVTVGDAHELLVTVHHALVDGWGMQLLMNDFAVAYEAAVAGREPVFETEPVSFTEHIAESNAARTDGRWDASLKYWREKLDGAVTTTLVADRHTYTGTGNTGGMVRYVFSKEAVEGIATLAKRYFTTPFSVLFAALQTVLARGGAGPEVCTGLVSANRMTPRDQALVGYLANVLVTRTNVADGDSFGTVIERVRDGMWDSLAHQTVPFSLVYGALTESAQARLRDAIPILVTWYGSIGVGVRLGDVSLRLQRAPNRAARTDLGFGVFDFDGEYVVESEYNVGRFDRSTAQGLFQDIDRVLAEGGVDPERPVAAIEVRTRTAPAYLEHIVTPAEPGTAEMPESAALDQVRRAWTDVLGTEPTGPDEDFFATGGRSLKVVQLASTIEAESGVALDITRWLAEPTPRRAAEQLAGDLDADGASTVVVLRDGNGPHLHLLPGAGGSVQDYRELVTELPADWLVTASQERTPLDSIPAMAARFRADLGAQGLRPDLLGGWSMGGEIAFEMAATGMAAPVVLLDSTPPVRHDIAQDVRDAVVYQVFTENMAATFGATLDGTPARTTPGDPELAMRVLAAQLSTATGQPVSVAMLVERWATFNRHTDAVGSYVNDRPLAVPAVLVRAELAEHQVDQWMTQFTTPPRLVRLDTDHYGILRAPAVAAVAGVIGELHTTATQSV
ncbi:condensation domain-containing protein [Actinophytocola sp.]|uniref:condensation domain-containing protein n=1 Tax=Actinophytocola sp. TaxID=1872138 RepID=UPI002D7066F8|nr:condensation domain-containing protein [Actinophytocola sp.]HYQ66123.1 condensation domain-containing protein [Actinophytocola sp.]